MAAENPTRTAPDESARVADDEFVIESFSAKNAFETPPPDTTADRAGASAAVVEDATVVVEEVEAPSPDGETPEDADHISASRLGAEQRTDQQPPVKPAKGKNKVPLKERTVQLKHEVDTLTHQKHRTKSELEADQRRLDDLKREIAASEAKLRGGPPSADAVTRQPATDEPTPMPELPDYRKFATDEEYEAAVGKYRTEMSAWHRAENERLERRIAQGVESRFQSDGDARAADASEQRLVATLDKVRTGKLDWNERAAALKDISSSWYDPTKHGDATAPFLSDLARARLSMGLEDGGDLLYWLGEDSDRAQVLADLFPTRPIRDAIVHAPSVLPLLEHFATDEGRAEFEALKQMHPIRVNQAIGALSVRLAGASSGSPAPPHPITKAQPSARPPAGTPGARGTTGPATTTKQSFETWMAEEDAKDQRARERLAGIAR